MKDRLTVSLLAFIAGALVILLSHSLFAPTPANAQLKPTTAVAPNGRYTAVAVPGGLPTVYVVDTQTSHTWAYAQTWTDLGMPAAASPGTIRRR